MTPDNQPNDDTHPADPLYSVGTWDIEAQGYTQQNGLSVPSFNITRGQLRQALKELRQMGYEAHRVRFKVSDCPDDYDWDNDWAVLVERTNGKPEAEILKMFER